MTTFFITADPIVSINAGAIIAMELVSPSLSDTAPFWTVMVSTPMRERAVVEGMTKAEAAEYLRVLTNKLARMSRGGVVTDEGVRAEMDPASFA